MVSVGGSPTLFQMIKEYSDAGATLKRPISKPVQGTLTVYDGASPLTEGVDFTVNYDTGRVTFTSGPADPRWEGEFDVPCRFATDSMPVSIDHYQTYSWGQISITEVRDPLSYVQQDEVTDDFHEVEFSDEYDSFGITGGPTFKTKVYSGQGGHESRILGWDQARGEYDLAQALKGFDDFVSLKNFYMARWGRAFGFRLHDWSDDSAIMVMSSIDDFTPKSTGAATFASAVAISDVTTGTFVTDGVIIGDIVRVRPGGPNEEFVAVTTVVNDNVILIDTLSVQIEIGESYEVYTAAQYESSQGMLGFGKEDVPENVQDGVNDTFQITKAYTSVNSYIRRIRKPVDATIRFWIDGTELTKVASETPGPGEFHLFEETGLIKSGDVPGAGADLAWTGDFRVAARFNTDAMAFTLENHGFHTWAAIPVVEIRQD
jgi:hypothetical protein